MQSCKCPECKKAAEAAGVAAIQHQPTAFEKHCGKGASKKWTASVKVVTTAGTRPIAIGEWLAARHAKSQQPPPAE